MLYSPLELTLASSSRILDSCFRRLSLSLSLGYNSDQKDGLRNM